MIAIWRCCNEHNRHLTHRISPDFDDAYLRMEVEPYVELMQTGSRVSSTYHVGLQRGALEKDELRLVIEGPGYQRKR